MTPIWYVKLYQNKYLMSIFQSIKNKTVENLFSSSDSNQSRNGDDFDIFWKKKRGAALAATRKEGQI